MSLNHKINIAIAEDHNLYRKALADAIQHSNNNFEVVLDVNNGQELIYEIRKRPVNVVILNIQMPIMSSKEPLKIIKDEFPNIKIIVLSMSYDDLTTSEWMSNGADAFLPKFCEIEDLLNAINEVIHKGFYFYNSRSVYLLNELISGDIVNSKNDSILLSDREIDVLKLVCQEFCSKEISEKLFISVRTVENHRNHINSKIGARNSIGLLIYALKKGLVRISSENRVVFD